MGTVRYTNVNGRVVAEMRNGVRKAYAHDPLGSTAALVDNTGTVTDTFEYWPYGEERTRTGTTPTPFRFSGSHGYYRDSATRTYVRARHYRQDHGRWMSIDPLWPNESAYGYVWQRPTTHVDPTGLQVRSTSQIGKNQDCGQNRDVVERVFTFCEKLDPIEWIICYGRLIPMVKRAEDAEGKAKLPGWDWPPRTNDGTTSNAFKHCYASCIAAREAGCWCAQAATALREGDDPNSLMDRHNDRIGRVLSERKGSCYDLCMGAVKNGDLVVLR